MNRWGPIPYTVESNELGLRATGFARASSTDRLRIVTIGDSVTDGFFVDDNGTFQHYLQQHLDQGCARRYGVLNAARGGGSIDKELAILRHVVLPLGPHIVMLVFVTNDIADLKGIARKNLFGHQLQFHAANLSRPRRAALWFVTQTAIGEGAFRLWWRVALNRRTAPVASVNLGDARYQIEGGGAFRRNAQIFGRVFAGTDGLVLRGRFTSQVRALVENYMNVLETFVVACRESGVVPVFVYFPSYTQVYAPATPMTIRDVLRENSRRLNMPFLDLTEPLRQNGKTRVLHLAPVDFHPNPAGNQVIARALYEFLRAQSLVE